MKSNIIFVGNFAPLADSMDHPGFSQAGIIFQTKFVDFLNPDLTISILPIFYSKKKRFAFHKPIHFVNNQSGAKTKINYLYRLVADTLETFNIIRNNKIPNVFYYNIEHQNFIAICLSKFLLRRKVYVLVADYANFGKGFLNSLYNRVLRKLDGVIILNSNIKCNTNSRLLLGLLYKKQIELNESGKLNRNIILSGSLGKTTGLNLALEFCSKYSDYNLFITGRPFRYSEDELLELIRSYQNSHSNIHYLGLLSYEEYIEVLAKCDFAFSLRNPDDLEHNFNFPSKILEYLSKSKMVISSKRYEDLEDGIILYSEFNVDSIKATLDNIACLSKSEIIFKRHKIYDYLSQNFTEETVNLVVKELLKGEAL